MYKCLFIFITDETFAFLKKINNPFKVKIRNKQKVQKYKNSKFMKGNR